MGHLPIIEKKPDTPRTEDSWKTGNLSYDHSNDVELAKAGDEAAQSRLNTKQRLARRKPVQDD